MSVKKVTLLIPRFTFKLYIFQAVGSDFYYYLVL